MYQWTLLQSVPLRNHMSARNSLWLWLRQCGYSAILKCFHWCNGHKIVCVPTLSLPTQNDSHSAHLVFLPTFDKLQRVSLSNFQGSNIQNWEKDEQKKWKDIQDRVEGWIVLFFFNFIYGPFFPVILILWHKRDILSILFLLWTQFKKKKPLLCLFVDLLTWPPPRRVLFVYLSIFLSSFLEEQGTKADKVGKGRGQAKGGI